MKKVLITFLMMVVPFIVNAQMPMTECSCLTGYSVDQPGYLEPTDIGGQASIDSTFNGTLKTMCDNYPDTPWSMPVQGWYCADLESDAYMTIEADVEVVGGLMTITITEEDCCGLVNYTHNTYILQRFYGLANYHNVMHFDRYAVHLIAIAITNHEVAFAIAKVPHNGWEVITYTIWNLKENGHLQSFEQEREEFDR